MTLALLILVLVFFVLLLLGLPVAHAMLPAIFMALVVGFDIPLSTVATTMVYAVDEWTWLAFPLFLFLGYMMNETGISDVLLDFCQELLGRIPGALSHIAVATAILISGISGSSSACAAATGALFIPAMKKAGYPIGYASMIIAGASLIDPLIPPSLALIMMAVIGELSVLRLWLAGVVPGLILGFALLITGYVVAKWRKFPRIEAPFSVKRTSITFLKSIPALIIPIFILGGMRMGIFTATEAGSVAVVYVVLFGVLYRRKLTFKQFQRASSNSLVVLASVMWIIAVAIAYGQIATILDIGNMLAEFTIKITSSSTAFLFMVSFVLTILGCFIEAAAVRLILYPLLIPTANAYGIDPIHFAMVFTYLTLLGHSTPPVGPGMFITNAIAECSVGEYVRDGWPLLVAQFALVPLFILLPGTVTWFPNLIMGPG